MWGIVGGNFEHLPHGIISKTLVRLLSIPLILMLSPDMTPDDPIPMEKDVSGIPILQDFEIILGPNFAGTYMDDLTSYDCMPFDMSVCHRDTP